MHRCRDARPQVPLMVAFCKQSVCLCYFFGVGLPFKHSSISLVSSGCDEVYMSGICTRQDEAFQRFASGAQVLSGLEVTGRPKLAPRFPACLHQLRSDGLAGLTLARNASNPGFSATLSRLCNRYTGMLFSSARMQLAYHHREHSPQQHHTLLNKGPTPREGGEDIR